MTFDFAIIGAGIAGASLAAELAPHASVVLLEAEDQPGYHSTGRSAALWHETLGGPFIQPLTTRSFDALNDGGFLSARGSLSVAEPQHIALLDEMQAKFAGTVALQRMSYEDIRARVPRAKPILAAGLLEPTCADIDVAALHAAVLSRFRRAGGTVETGFRVEAIERLAKGWRVSAGDKAIEATTIVNAAGAWGDVVAKLAGAEPLGLQPCRRTIAQVRVDGDDVPADLPMVTDVGGSFYFKPEGPNRLWLCPQDETPVDPGDAAPEDIDVAIAIDRFESVTDWKVLAVERKWAGLRTFAPDRLPIYGFDPIISGLFWCAGQGGIGIQTSPAAARLSAAILLGQIPEIDPAPYSPMRFC
ncbi:FAD-binding oxidoreductase [Sphingomonas paeninsulae]|uniref:FAD-binding oxidoreductase n=1 Tax=Sphingomonas paeninsulae TaxID=2319844 RepID=A0A494TCM8_SPHPE|nr:FAD-binding oxidoreductase [Sphingomonas paeninsulae]AYJ87239.1 FAD-binding oxidoreductase [Sphingomonas paeninsulae]